MKRKRIFSLIILSIVMLIGYGCDELNYDNNKDNQVDKNKEVVMTKRQEEVFRSYGLSEEEISEMKENGMTYKQQSFADTAIIMLDYLEEKYGESFELVGGDIPGLFADYYWITAKVCEGEHAGRTFDVYFRGHAGCTDGYISILKEEEAVEALKNLIYEKFSDVIVTAKMIGEYGDEITVDMTGEDLLHLVEYVLYLVITEPDMDENSFQQKVEEIEKYLDEHNVSSQGHIFCFAIDVDTDISHSELKHMLKNDVNREIVIWNDYIATQ